LKSFSPIVGAKPKVLILGSMPSALSLSGQQYYGNPNNAFWWIMSEMLGFSLDLSYKKRTEQLKQSPFAIWDVLESCERQGSLDSSIVRESETPNNILQFLNNYPDVSLLAFNGGAAKKIYQRHCAASINQVYSEKNDLEFVQLPSTSPAYASMKRDAKLKLWLDAFKKYL